MKKNEKARVEWISADRVYVVILAHTVEYFWDQPKSVAQKFADQYNQQ